MRCDCPEAAVRIGQQRVHDASYCNDSKIPQFIWIPACAFDELHSPSRSRIMIQQRLAGPERVPSLRWGIFALLVGSMACDIVFGSGGAVAFLVVGLVLGATFDTLFWLHTFRRIRRMWFSRRS
jgi:hypothetical protein